MKYGAWLAVMLLMTGCTIHPAKPVSERILNGERWSAQGRIGITGVAQSGTASFRWNQQGEVSRIQLRGPVGIGSMSIVADDSLHITSSNGTHYDADAALTELEMRLGVAVPVKQMRYWLRGMPAPGEYQWLSQHIDHQSVLQQDGWSIALGFNTYETQLPEKIMIAHQQIHIKIVIQNWDLHVDQLASDK